MPVLPSYAPLVDNLSSHFLQPFTLDDLEPRLPSGIAFLGLAFVPIRFDVPGSQIGKISALQMVQRIPFFQRYVRNLLERLQSQNRRWEIR